MDLKWIRGWSLKRHHCNQSTVSANSLDIKKETHAARWGLLRGYSGKATKWVDFVVTDSTRRESCHRLRILANHAQVKGKWWKTGHARPSISGIVAAWLSAPVLGQMSRFWRDFPRRRGLRRITSII